MLNRFTDTRMDRDQRIYHEAAALWRALYGEPPPAAADGPAMLEAITRGLPDVNYDRLRTPYLRPGAVVMPR